MDIMYDSIDAVDVGDQPQREIQVYYYFYYVLFIIVGAFFTLNLLVGVIVGTEQTAKTIIILVKPLIFLHGGPTRFGPQMLLIYTFVRRLLRGG